jgi:hypothetical protein
MGWQHGNKQLEPQLMKPDTDGVFLCHLECWVGRFVKGRGLGRASVIVGIAGRREGWLLRNQAQCASFALEPGRRPSFTPSSYPPPQSPTASNPGRCGQLHAKIAIS